MQRHWGQVEVVFQMAKASYFKSQNSLLSPSGRPVWLQFTVRMHLLAPQDNLVFLILVLGSFNCAEILTVSKTPWTTIYLELPIMYTIVQSFVLFLIEEWVYILFLENTSRFLLQFDYPKNVV